MLAKRRRQPSSADQASLQVVGDMGCWVDSSVDIGTHLRPQLDQRLPTLQVMFYRLHRSTECQLEAMVVGDPSLLRWTPLIQNGGKLGVMI